MKHQEDLLRVVQFYESLSVDTVSRVADIYAPDAWFKDPFNEVRGVPEIARIFTHMFVQVEAPGFIVTNQVAQDDNAFLTWEFRFRMKRSGDLEQCIRGASHLRFSDDGKVDFHRDYWDAAEELYEKIPLLASLMRALKRAVRK